MYIDPLNLVIVGCKVLEILVIERIYLYGIVWYLYIRSLYYLLLIFNKAKLLNAIGGFLIPDNCYCVPCQLTKSWVSNNETLKWMHESVEWYMSCVFMQCLLETVQSTKRMSESAYEEMAFRTFKSVIVCFVHFFIDLVEQCIAVTITWILYIRSKIQSLNAWTSVFSDYHHIE